MSSKQVRRHNGCCCCYGCRHRTSSSKLTRPAPTRSGEWVGWVGLSYSGMAPALSSSSFRLATAQPHCSSKTQCIHHRFPRSNATVFLAMQGDANNNGATFPSFRFGGTKKKALDEGGSVDGGAWKKQPFLIDLGKQLPDPMSLVPAAGGGPSPAAAALQAFVGRRRKDPRAVFVAGAMGQAGVRIARTLLREDFSVRAGVPELAAAQALTRIAVQYKIISPEESKRLNAVETAFGDVESIAKAIGNAAKVVVSIGRGEDGPSGDVTTDDALQVVRAAQLAGVDHVTVVYDTSSDPPGAAAASTYNVLDGITSFFNNLFARPQAPLTVGEFLNKVAGETEVRYTLIKASLADDGDAAADGAEGLLLAAEGGATAAGTGTNESAKTKVSKWQIASLVADVFSNSSVAENKVVEVSANPSPHSQSVEELLSAIPEDGRRKAYQEAVAKAKAEKEAVMASEKAREAAEKARKLEEGAKKKLPEQEAGLAEEVRQKAEEAGSALENILTRAKGLRTADFSWGKLSTQFATAAARTSEEIDARPKTQIATVRGQAKARSLPRQRAVVKQPPPAPKTKPRKPEPRAKPAPAPAAEKTTEVKKMFGGLFQQQTIYVDDD